MKKIFSVILIFILISTAAFAEPLSIDDTAKYLKTAVPNPTVASIGGEWTVIALARSGMDLNDDYFQKYYCEVEKYAKIKNGVLHEKKYTEYARVVLALNAIGKNPENVGGYNLIAPLLDFDKTVWQGINGAIWALIALDSDNYAADDIKKRYIEHIISRQNADGGWAISENASSSDADITAMALVALAKYRNEPDINSAAEAAIDFLSSAQCDDGGFASYGSENSESAAQVLTALCTLGIPRNDPRFVKNGKTMVDNIYSYKNADGSFSHTDSAGIMATEQCCYALVAAMRADSGKSALFDMSDVERTDSRNPTNTDSKINVPPIKFLQKTFADINDHKAQTAIEALAQRGIINGTDENRFAPDSTMTRAEFAAITVRALGLPMNTSAPFSDVLPTDWHCAYVGAAYAHGLIKGVSDSEFDPNGTITNEQAAAMMQRAAALCGMNGRLNDDAIKNTLAEFVDYKTVSDWAKESVAFCYANGISDRSEIEIRPHNAAKRYEIAQMIYNLLKGARLI